MGNRLNGRVQKLEQVAGEPARRRERAERLARQSIIHAVNMDVATLPPDDPGPGDADALVDRVLRDFGETIVIGGREFETARLCDRDRLVEFAREQLAGSN